jgi:hypothetical protein
VTRRGITTVGATTRTDTGALTAVPSAAIGATVTSPSFVLSVTPSKSNATLARRVCLACLLRRVYVVRRFPISRRLIQQIANLPTLSHHFTVERALITAASTPLQAAISLVSAVSQFLARLHTRNSRCV